MTAEAASAPPLCPGCRRRIGVYEPIWHVATASGAQRTSWLALTGSGEQALEGVLWHAECAERDGVPGG
jgi:hypothetical protein